MNSCKFILVNDYLRGIMNERVLWNFMLEGIPNLIKVDLEVIKNDIIIDNMDISFENKVQLYIEKYHNDYKGIIQNGSFFNLIPSNKIKIIIIQDNLRKMNYKVTVFEDNKLAPLNYYSGNEIEALESIISNYHSEKMDLPYFSNDEETSYGVLYDVDEEKMKKYENKKIHVNPPQYGVNPWGKVEILFEKDDSIINNVKSN